MWSVDKTRNLLTINLEKMKETMWKSVLMGESEIDLSKVDTTRDISEFDPECQAAIQRVSYDQHLKRQGKPTSSEKVCTLLECFGCYENWRCVYWNVGRRLVLSVVIAC